MGSIPQVSVLRGLATDSFLPEKYLHRLFERNARLHNNNTAILYKGAKQSSIYKLSYQELDRAANRLARSLLDEIRSRGSQGPNKDGNWVVAVRLSPSDALLLTLLAIWKAGAAYLPLDKCAPPGRVQHIVNEAQPALIVNEDSIDVSDDVYKADNVVSFNYLDEKAAGMSAEVVKDHEMLVTSNEPIGIVLYTSGSTGVPKGVIIPHSAIFNRLTWQWREFPYGTNEQITVFKTALTFVDAVSEIWGPLLSSDPKTVLVVSREAAKDTEQLINLLEEFKIERLVLVPSLLRAILQYLNLAADRKLLLSSLKLWVCSGEPLPKSLALEFLDHFSYSGGDHMLCNFYGSTEVMGDVTYFIMKTPADLDGFDGKVPIGRPLDNTMIYLMDKNLKPVSVGDIGEIFASGRNLAHGYVKGRDPERFVINPHTVDPDQNRLYSTGDYGRIVKNVVVFEGRTDSQIKVRGHRVDLAEIDASLSRLEEVNKSVVLCYRPGEVDQAIIAYVTLSPGYDTPALELENKLMNSLPPYSIPQVLVIDSIPLLVNGKVDRQTLLKKYENNNVINGNIMDDVDLSSLPENKHIAAQCLVKTVASVIGASLRSRISLESNFYSLGGNSLNSVYTVTRLRDQGFTIGITEFVSSENLRQIIDRMVPETEGSGNNHSTSYLQPIYTTELLTEDHKASVYKMITDSFSEKADLEQWIVPPILPENYHEMMDKMWPHLLEARLSFVVKSEDNKCLGVSLSFDAHKEPEIVLTSKFQIVFDFLEKMEQSVRDELLPKGEGQVLHSFMMGTNSQLSPAENVAVMQYMEQENLRLARTVGFVGIFTTNTSPLTQQLGTDVFGYKVLKEYRVNHYIAPDGTKPFGKAPDSQTISVSWKTLDQ